MKRITALLLTLAISTCLFSSDYFDIALTLGTDSMYGYYGPYSIEDSLRVKLALSLGLTSRIEASLGLTTALTPSFFKENTAYLEFDYALLGARSTKSKISGASTNTHIGIGAFYSYAPREEGFKGTGGGVYLSITPLTLRTPVYGYRERFLKTNAGYDFINERVVISFSVITMDFYLRGTYRDYY